MEIDHRLAPIYHNELSGFLALTSLHKTRVQNLYTGSTKDTSIERGNINNLQR